MRQRRNVDSVVQAEVAKLLSRNPEYTAPELKELVEKNLKKRGEKYNFGTRTYSNLKHRLKPNLEPEALDKPWSMGSLWNFNLPPNYISLILGAQLGYKDTNNPPITIRQAKWLTTVFDALRYVKKIREIEKKSYEDVMNWVAPIAQVYSMFDRIFEILEVEHDTRVFDDMFFVSQTFFDMPDEQKRKVIIDMLDEEAFQKRYLIAYEKEFGNEN